MNASLDPTHLSVATSAPERALPPGTTIEGIEIAHVIADTDLGLEYLAIDHRQGISVVLAEYMPRRLSRREGVAVWPQTPADAESLGQGLLAFIDEAKLLTRIDHPSLVHVNSVIQANATAYRVMPQRVGTPLLRVRQATREPPNEKSVRALFDGLLGALDALHRDGMLHGAITPSTILLLDDERPLLLGPDSARAAIASGLVESLMAALEPSFAAPEQRDPSPIWPLGAWSDLYSLAETMRFYISGELPPPAAAPLGSGRREPTALLVRRLFGDASVLHYGPSLLKAIDAALDTIPAARPQSVAAFRTALATMPKPMPPTPMAAPTPTAAQPPAPAPISKPMSMSMPMPKPLSTPPPTPPRGNLGAVPDSPRAARQEASAAASRIEPAFHFEPFSAGPGSPFAMDEPAPIRATGPREPIIAPPDAPAPSAPTAAPIIVKSPRARHRVLWAASVFVLLLGAGTYGWWQIGQPGQAELPTIAVTPVTPAPGIEPTAPTPAPAPTQAQTPPAQTPPPVAAQAPPPVAETTPSAAATTGPAPAPTAAVGPTQAPAPAQAQPATPAPAPAQAPAQAPAPAPAPAPAQAQTPTPPPAVAASPPPAAPRAATTARARTPAAPAPTRPKAAAPLATSPRDACSGRTQFALYRCMQTQCAQSSWEHHPQCVRLRSTDSVD